MSAQTVPTSVFLPRSHYFLTISRSEDMRAFAIRAGVVHLLACVLPLLSLVGVAATGYVLFHDEVVASLMARQSQMQYAYEDRIDALRNENQRQTARQMADRTTLEAKLRDLVSRESQLETRAGLMAGLASQAGVATASLDQRPNIDGGHAAGDDPLSRIEPTGPALSPDAMGYSPVPRQTPSFLARPKPHPEADLDHTAAPVDRAPGPLSELDHAQTAVGAKLALVGDSLDRIERVQVGALARIGFLARQETARLEAALDGVGLSVQRFQRRAPPEQGGPFVPLPTDRETSFGRALADMQEQLSSAVRLRGVVAQVPLANPLPGPPEVTSPFGARLDPFLGRPALHTGVDLHESFGVEVRATAPGRVSFAGAAGGYGNMVEIDHGNGLATRYAHLEEILVSQGESAGRDTVVGKVGATGRATGPHLHYEVRIDGEPVDPVRFLDVGLHLARAETP